MYRLLLCFCLVAAAGSACTSEDHSTAWKHGYDWGFDTFSLGQYGTQGHEPSQQDQKAVDLTCDDADWGSADPQEWHDGCLAGGLDAIQNPPDWQ